MKINKINSEIDALILESTRKGLTPRYIVIGQSQYMRWIQEEEAINKKVENQYNGCDVVICNSDILEVVPDPKELYSYFKRNQ